MARERKGLVRGVFCAALAASFLVGMAVWAAGPVGAGGRRENDPLYQVWKNQSLFEQLSSAAQNAAVARYGVPPYVTPVKPPAAPPRAQASPSPEYVAPGCTPANVLVNDPSLDTAQYTQSETSITLAGPGNVVVAYNNSRLFSNPGSLHFTGWSTSTNDGASFTDRGALPDSPNGDVGDPVLVYNSATGDVYLATLMFSGSGIQVFKSTDGGVSFGAPVNAAPGKSGFQDKPWLAIDNHAGTGQGNLYLVERDFGTGNGVYFYSSTDGGTTWGPNGGSLIASGNQGAYVAVGPNHEVYVFWWTYTGIMCRTSTDNGATFGPATTVATFLSGGGTNGDLGLGFRTNRFPAAAVNPFTGEIYVVYNDKPASSDRCDIYMTESAAGGTAWTPPVRVNDDAGLNDQFMPTVAVSPSGQYVFVTWYDRRNDPSNNLIDRYGVMGDALASPVVFNANFRITDQSFPPVYGGDPRVNPTYMGDYDQAVAGGDFFYTSWGDNRSGNPDVRFAKIPFYTPVSSPAVLPDATTGTPYSQNFTGYPGTAPFTFTVPPGSLPPGLSLSSSGTLSGTPTTAGTYTFTVTTRDTYCAAGDATYTMNVVCPAILLVPGNSTPFSIDTTPSWDGSNTVAYFGHPNTATYGQTITAPAGGAVLTDFTFYMKVPSTCVFRGEVYAWDGTKATGSALWEGPPIATNDAAFNPVTFNTGGVALSGGQQYVLFASVSRDSGSGQGPWGYTGSNVYSGGHFVFINNGMDPSQWTTINWTTLYPTNGDLAFKADFLIAVLPDAQETLPYSFLLDATGGTPSYTYTLTGGALPAGLSLSPSGEISGAANVVGTFQFTVTATDVYGCAGSQHYVLNVVCPTITITPDALPGATKDTAYNATLSASPGVAPYSYAVSSGSLPAGLSLSSSGAISGTPTTTGPSTFTVTVTDANGCTGTKTYSVYVFTFDFMDDAGTTQACVDADTGFFQWSVLTGPYAGMTYTGNLNVYNGGTMFWSQPGASQYVYLYYDPNGHTAWGYLYDYTTYAYTSLYDTNTLNNPACGAAGP